MILIYALVRLTMGSPVIFVQHRPGKNGRPFNFVKFRTMLNADIIDQKTLPDQVRITRLGRVLRSFSIDEFPSIFNVLRGDMSLVGPRPLLMEYLPLYSSEQSRRHDVKPGITGWAQINGRNAISWEQKFQYDLWYVENQSFFLDIRIILLTVLKVLKREGINSNSNITMEKFEGSNE